MFISIIKFLLDPFNIFLLLLVATLLTLLVKKKQPFKWLFSASMLWFLLISTAPLPQTLLISLEYRDLPLTENDAIRFGENTHIVVLGGGHGFNDKLPANSLLSEQALARLNEGVRLHRLIPGSKLVLSGYSNSGRTTQAEMLQAAALNIGVKPEDTLLKNEPSNTYEEAKAFSESFDRLNEVIVVSSAAHIPRAVMLFETCGVNVTVSPTHYRVIDPKQKQIWPSVKHIEHLRIALYEYAGIFRDGFREC